MNSWLLVFISMTYLGLLFGLAWVVENRSRLREKVLGSSWVYALSLTVYCSAWTFYGSVGRASLSGLDFLAIYLGPCLMLPLWWVLVRKLVRVTRVHRISSLADFISARYGKRQMIGTLTGGVLVVVIVPYISLQIKAISESFLFLSSGTSESLVNIWKDPGLYATLFLMIFTIVFGVRYLEANRARPGMVSVVAFEGIFKLVAFLIAGIAIIYGLFGGMGNLMIQATGLANFDQLVTIQGRTGFSDWFWLLVISGLSILLLPRQFQVAVVENQDEQHLKRAMWVFPLYLLMINLFVLPVALAGRLSQEGLFTPDYALLGLANQVSSWLGGLVFLGGFSAASSMMIVSTIALGTMLANNVLIPIRIRADNPGSMVDKILNIRRLSLGLIPIMAFLYYRYFTENEPLLSIGILSFIGVSQLAPAIIGGMYWKRATHQGALAGILSGFAMWFYLLILPTMGFRDLPLMEPFEGLSTTSHAIFMTMMINVLLFSGISSMSQQNQEEQTQAELFVDIFKLSRNYDAAGINPASASFPTIRSLLIKFLGDQRTSEVLDRYARMNQIDWKANPKADSRLIAFAERLLTEAIGPASARIMIASVVQEEDISMQEVVNILKESQQVIGLNKKLQFQSEQLQKLTEELRQANERLLQLSAIKDDFLYTVTHELRTPLTSIRAQAEILLDMDDLTVEEREQFLQTIVKDCERLTRLITDVLDLEKFESGNQKLNLSEESIADIIQEALDSTENLMRSKGIAIKTAISNEIPTTWLDRDRIIQVLLNLLGNAIKFCNQEAGEIRVVAFPIDGRIKVSVIDNGEGIEPEKMSRVFEKFYQAHNQLRKKPSGSGLGLAICKNIVMHHGGQINLQREQPTGTRFTFELPIYKNTQQFIAHYETTLKKDFNRG
jgi:signal transduction histidine kinase/Na+/proline symporter